MSAEIGPTQFETEVIRSDRPVLVDFFTPTCGPCRTMLPVVAGIAEERAALLKVVKLDATKDYALAARFRVSTLPSFILFQRGVPVGQRIGVASKRDLLARLDSTLS